MRRSVAVLLLLVGANALAHGMDDGDTRASSSHSHARGGGDEIRRVIEERNADKADGAVHGLGGPFDHLSPHEFRQKVLMPPRPAPKGSAYESHKQTTMHADKPHLQDSFDWRDEDAVTAVKDQGTLGTCWAFSTVGSLEGQMAIQYKSLTNLSVEQLVECDASVDTDTAMADCGEFGGWPYLAYDYVKNAGGMWLDDDWPYCAYEPRANWDDECYPCMASGYSVTYCGWHGDMYCNASSTYGQGAASRCASDSGAVITVTSWEALSSNETELAASLASLGPVSVLMNAARLQYYKSGIYSPSYCDPEDLDHAVLLTGFGSENGTDYWTVKNSWGTSWGEDGYFRIARGAGMCGINTAAVLPSVVVP